VLQYYDRNAALFAGRSAPENGDDLTIIGGFGHHAMGDRWRRRY
jgi:hypothetical protein